MINSKRRTPAVTRERGVGIYILAEVVSASQIRCHDKDVEYYETKESKIGSVVSLGEVTIAACHLSFERAQLCCRTMR